MTTEEIDQLAKVIYATNEHLLESFKRPSWYEHMDLVQIALVGLVGYFIWSWKRILDKFETSIATLQKDHGDLRNDVSRLEGRIEHHGLVCYGRRMNDEVKEPGKEG
jgi:preprotein translocase subunit Sss1